MNGPVVRPTATRALRIHATPKIAPITRAIRHAMAVSATVLALSAGGQAQAGVRAPAVLSAPHASHAAFISPASDITPIDLTRVDGHDHPASVRGAEALTRNDAGIAPAGSISDVTYVGDDVVDYVNDTTIDVSTQTVDDVALAVGMYGYASESVTLRNYGDVAVGAESVSGYALAYGALDYAGIGLVINGGQIDVAATTGAGSQAHATGINVVGDVGSVFNDGDIGVSATAGDGGLADARGARAYSGYSAVANYGDIAVAATANGGTAQARGEDSLGYFGSSVYNAGAVQADATAGGGQATAIGTYSVGYVFSAYTSNTGQIAATATGDAATAYGALNFAAYLGAAITTNSGDISATAVGGIAPYGSAEATAFGIYNFALVYDSVVDNSGTVSASAAALADMSGSYGFLQARAVGIEAINGYGYRDTAITNTGDIHATAETSQGYASAWAAAAASSGAYGGAVRIDNTGSLSAQGHVDVGIVYATGAYALNQAGYTEVVNAGDISTYARAESGLAVGILDYAYATGIRAISLYGDTYVANTGMLAAQASGYGAITGGLGIQAYGHTATVVNAEGANIVASGEVDQFGGGFATGIEAAGLYAVDVVNYGDIAVYGHAHAWDTHYGAGKATGIYASAGVQGNVSVQNNGNITAYALAEDSLSWAQGGAGAVGINAYAKYDASVVNNGDIHAIANAQFGISAAYGVIGHGKYSTSVVNAAGASIVAEATVGSLASDEYGGRAISFGTHVFGDGMDHAEVYNAGSIVSHATVVSDAANPNPSLAKAWGASAGAYTYIQSGTIVNRGDIEAAASADFGYATAYGSYVVGGLADTRNDGTIVSTAQADQGNAWAVGSLGIGVQQTYYVPCELVDGPYGPYYSCDYSNAHWQITGGDATLDNGGSIAARAQAAGGLGYSYGATALGGNTARITNAGHIQAITDADDALATGAVANALYGQATVINHGDILASATGTTASAFGVIALGATGAQVENSGRILAGAYGDHATATAVALGDTGANVLTNSGTIGAYGDGTRIAVSSGSGATASIANSGRIIGAIRTGDGDDVLENAATGVWSAIGDSDFGAGSDRIANLGTIAVTGADNRIAVDLLDNDGLISFADGHADGMLTVVGDFAGTGTLRFDVSGLQQTGDRLALDGQVLDTAAQAIDVNLLDLPNTRSFLVPLLDSTGALGGEFALGHVLNAQGGFVTLDFGLSRSAHQLALTGDVSGLNGAGSVAAAVAPGVQDLVEAQIGSWRQRVGAEADSDRGLTPWLRAFSQSGGIAGRHSANFGAGGSFDFHQSNHGLEAGLAFWPTEHLVLGVLAADAHGSQDVTGAGRDRFDSRSTGVFATWLGDRGFYLDLSHRWIDVDARLNAAEGAFDTQATARALNVETGFTAWTTKGGLHVVPQLQYTRTRITGIDALHGSLADFTAIGGSSSRGRVGVALNRSFEGPRVTWSTYGAVSAVREFAGEYGYAINQALRGTTGTGGTSARLELGLGAQRGPLSVNVGLDWTDGGAVDSSTGGQLVLRYTW